MEAANPADAFLKFALAQEYSLLGNYSRAEECYRCLQENFPDYVPQYYHYGKLLEQLHRQEDAVDVYEAGIEKSTAQRDQHSLGELKEALLLLQDEE